MKIERYRSLMVTHPLTGKRIQVQEHVYIWLLANGLWQKGITRTERGFIVHHKDLDHRNNDIANLQLLSASEHVKLHWDLDREGRSRRVSKSLAETYSARRT